MCDEVVRILDLSEDEYYIPSSGLIHPSYIALGCYVIDRYVWEIVMAARYNGEGQKEHRKSLRR